MRFRLCLLLLAAYCATFAFAEEVAPSKKLSPEERKRKFEALKKELEAFRPAADAAEDEQAAYFQQVISLSQKFAKENPQSAEGFEAAFTAAVQLAQKQHAQTGELAQTAIDAAPTAGVDKRQLATCWVLIAFGKLLKNEVAAGREALEKVKPLDEDLYERARQQLEQFEAQKKKK